MLQHVYAKVAPFCFAKCKQLPSAVCCHCRQEEMLGSSMEWQQSLCVSVGVTYMGTTPLRYRLQGDVGESQIPGSPWHSCKKGGTTALILRNAGPLLPGTNQADSWPLGDAQWHFRLPPWVVKFVRHNLIFMKETWTKIVMHWRSYSPGLCCL